MNDIPTGPTRDHSTYLGASDIAAIAGLNPYVTPLDVWARKLKKGPAFEGNIHTKIGSAFERPALDIYAQEQGVSLTYPGTLIHPRYPWAGATPDAVANHRKVVECKIVGGFTGKRWGDPEDGADAIPPDVLCQVHWQSWIGRVLNICPGEVADVVCFQGTRMLVYSDIEIDDVMIEGLRDLGQEFWEMNVLGNVMPAVEKESDVSILQALYPRQQADQLLPLTEEVAELARIFDHWRTQETKAKGIKDRTGAEIRRLLGEAPGMEDRAAGIRVTWKAGKGKPAWKKIAENVGARISKPLYRSIVTEHTPEKGSRTLNVRVPDAEKGSD